MAVSNNPFGPRIGVFVSSLDVKGGAELVAAELAKGLNAQLYTLKYDPEQFDSEFHDEMWNRIVNIANKKDYSEKEISEILSSDMPTTQMSPTAAFGSSAIDIADLDKVSADLLIACDNPGAVLCYHSGKPYLTYLHHPAKGFYDYFFEQIERESSLKNKFKFTYNRFKYVRQVKSAVKHSEHIAVNSERTKQRTKEVWNVADDDMTTVYPPVKTDLYTPGEPDTDIMGLDRYFLAPQRLEPYKNINVLIEAAKEAQEHVVLVGVGRIEDYARREAHYSDYVHTLGYVDDEMLRDLYRNAEATLQATLREDFGIVPVESIACGTPVILPASGGFKETIGEGHGDDVPDVPYQTRRGYLMDPDKLSPQNVASILESFDKDDYDSEGMRADAEEYSVERFITEMNELATTYE